MTSPLQSGTDERAGQEDRDAFVIRSEVHDGKPSEPPEPIKLDRRLPLTLAVSFRDRKRRLPVVRIKRAAGFPPARSTIKPLGLPELLW